MAKKIKAKKSAPGIITYSWSVEIEPQQIPVKDSKSFFEKTWHGTKFAFAYKCPPSRRIFWQEFLLADAELKKYIEFLKKNIENPSKKIPAIMIEENRHVCLDTKIMKAFLQAAKKALRLKYDPKVKSFWEKR